MMKHTLSFAVLVTAFTLAYFVVSAAASGVAVTEDAAVAVATVVSVDEQTRDITLAVPDGDHWTFKAGDEVGCQCNHQR